MCDQVTAYRVQAKITLSWSTKGHEQCEECSDLSQIVPHGISTRQFLLTKSAHIGLCHMASTHSSLGLMSHQTCQMRRNNCPMTWRRAIERRCCQQWSSTPSLLQVLVPRYMVCHVGIPVTHHSRVQTGTQSGPRLHPNVTGCLRVGPKCVAQCHQPRQNC